MVHARTSHGIVLGDKEYELVPVHARKDQSAAVLGHDFYLVEPENLAPEAADITATAFIEQVGRQTHGHMVEVGIARRVIGMCHQAPPVAATAGSAPSDSRGTTMTLPAYRPAARPASASDNLSRVTSSASISRSVGNPSLASSSSARSNPPLS